MPDPITYPNSTIMEALAEIRFRLAAGHLWQPEYLGKYYLQVQHEYPDMIPQFDTVVQFQLGIVPPAGLSPESRTRSVYRHHGQTHILQLAPNVLAANFLPPYPGWSGMQDVIRAAWNHLLHVFQPEAVEHIGLRYINRIPLEHEGQQVSHWLCPNQYFAASVLDSTMPFLSRSEVGVGDTVRTAVTVAFDGQPSQTPFGNVIFDIDRSSAAVIAPTAEALTATLEMLHEGVWNIFHTSKSEHLENLLKGRVQ